MAKAPRENRIPIMMSHEELVAVDDWRFSHRIATRSDAIRRLCRMALATQPLIMEDAMDQVEQLSDIIRAIRQNFLSLDRETRAGKWLDTATPENILSDVTSELSVIADHAYWLQLQLLEINNTMAAIAQSSPASAKGRVRKVSESIERDRADFIHEREQGFENMLLAAVTDAMTPDQRKALDQMPDDDAETYLGEMISELKSKLERSIGLTVDSRVYQHARGQYLYDLEKLQSFAKEVTGSK